jgi:hypothetical protein
MIEIVSKRISGNGLGSSINFPTINFVLEKLPDGVDVGLWAISSRDGSGVSLISKEYTSKGSSIPVYRIETHILNARYVNVSPGKDFKIFLLSKLREHLLCEDQKEMIKYDKKLANNYFKGVDTCYNCELFSQRDYGYSNYTVEGTTLSCYMNKFDDVESIERDIKYTALGCEFFTKGDMWSFDVDGESERPTAGWIESSIRNAKLKALGI